MTTGFYPYTDPANTPAGSEVDFWNVAPQTGYPELGIGQQEAGIPYIPEDIANDPAFLQQVLQMLKWLYYQRDELGVKNWQGMDNLELMNVARTMVLGGQSAVYGEQYGQLPYTEGSVLFDDNIRKDPSLLQHFGYIQPDPFTRPDLWAKQIEGAYEGYMQYMDFESALAEVISSGQVLQSKNFGSPKMIMPQYPTPQYQGPPAPWFLSEVTGLKAGQPIQPMPTKLASGQYLSKLTPSELQGLGGYINWSAGQVSGAPASYEDWLYESQELLPSRVPRGVTQWSPSSYWG